MKKKADNTRQFLALMDPAERRLLHATLRERVTRDPENTEPLTLLFWAIVQDIVDIEDDMQQLNEQVDAPDDPPDTSGPHSRDW